MDKILNNFIFDHILALRDNFPWPVDYSSFFFFFGALFFSFYCVKYFGYFRFSVYGDADRISELTHFCIIGINRKKWL